MPQGKLLLDAAGGIYGTTIEGGGGACTDGLLNPVGCGIVYKLSPPSGTQAWWSETILHSFQGPEGAYPQGGLIMDTTGTLFGTTSGGGPTSYGVGGYGCCSSSRLQAMEGAIGQKPRCTTSTSPPAVRKRLAS